MAGLINYQDPYSALGQGLSQGLGNMAQIVQMRYGKQQQQTQKLREEREAQQQTIAMDLDNMKFAVSMISSLPESQQGEARKKIFSQLKLESPQFQKLAKSIASFSAEDYNEATGIIKQIESEWKKPEGERNLNKIITSTTTLTYVGKKYKDEAAAAYAQTMRGLATDLQEQQRPEKPTALQGKIAETQKAYPQLSGEHARKIALGTHKLITNPITGETQLVDIGTQEVIPLKGGKGAAGEAPGTPAQAPTGQPKQTIYGMADFITGPISQLKETGSVVSGLVGGPIAEKTIQARQFVRGAQNDLIRALSINPRFPVAEMNRIRDAVRIEPKFFDNPAMLRSRIKAIDNYLMRRLENEKRTANDATMPVTDRRAAKQGANDIQNFLKILGAPKLKPGTIEDGYRFKGGDPADSKNWMKVR